MQLPWQVVEISDYAFDAPAAVVSGRLHRFATEAWHSGEAWQDALSQLPEAPAAFVFPLELSAPGRRLQDLLGYRLFVHLRFAAPDSIAGLPVLLAAWQPLQAVLSKTRDLLMVTPAVEFWRLPDASQRLPGFVRDASSGTLVSVSRTEIENVASGADDDAARVSYHDLANEYYAAHRLWIGYKALLEGSKEKTARDHLKRIADVRFDWEPTLEAKLRTPLVRRFRAQRAHQPAPRYRSIENATRLVATHASDGLPGDTRVLLVDDEFDKGVADVLLRILFNRAEAFTARLPAQARVGDQDSHPDDEWVYSESDNHGRRWARFVCVRDIVRAWYWLAYWETTDTKSTDRLSRTEWLHKLPRPLASDQTPRSDPSWHAWLRQWDRTLSPKTSPQRKGARTPEDVFADDTDFELDQHSMGSRAKSTFILLDLRLNKITTDLYSFKELDSYKFRHALKDERPDIPVVMFTASRQILNLAEVLDASETINGWFIKEGPDVPTDAGNTNSANAVAYLLERLHLYSALGSWYRESFGWTAEQKFEVARMLNSPEHDDALEAIEKRSTSLLGRIVAPDRNEPDWDPDDRYWEFIIKNVRDTPFPVVRRLVARRLALATLLWTAIDPQSSKWSVSDWDTLLPGYPARPALKKPDDKMHFGRILWMRSYNNVLALALDDELRWLIGIDWPQDKKQDILTSLRREIESRS